MCARRSRCQPGWAIRLGVSICEELWDEFYPSSLWRMVAKGADVILNLNASPLPGRRQARDETIRPHLAVRASR